MYNNVSTHDYEKYEYFVMDYHRKNHNQLTWHWRNIPEIELEKAGWITDYNLVRLARLDRKKNNKITNLTREYGLDGLSLDSEGNYHGIQAKYWKSRNLTAHDLGTFISVIFSRLFQRNNKSCGYLYYTCGLQKDLRYDIKNNSNLIQNKLLYDPNVINESIIDEPNYKLYPPQIEALEALNEDWDGLGLISMPGGLGKTLIIGNYIKEHSYQHIIVLSPLRVQTNQTLERLKKFIPSYYSLLVDSDSGGTTDPDYIFTMLKKHKCLISITYDSFETIIGENINKFDETHTLIIVDEAHNLTHKLINIIEQFDQTLLLTATPSSILENIVSCFVLYDYPFREAINNGYVCDYNIHIPLLDIDSNKVNITIPPELEQLNNDLTMKCLFLISGLLETGSSKCIIYCQSIDECIIFNKIFTKICNDYHGLSCWTNIITSNVNITNRSKILHDFQYNNLNRFNILSSVRILDEGVNIIKCDSIFITTQKCNNIRAVQRLYRAVRIDNHNPNKIAHCFIWSNDLHKLVGTLEYLKHSDETFFYKKINTFRGNYDDKIDKIDKTKTIDYHKTVEDYVKIKSINLKEKWFQTFEQLIIYIKENNDVPHVYNSDPITKSLAYWYNNNNRNYDKNTHIMKIPEYKEKWQDFRETYNIYTYNNSDRWNKNLQKVKDYIDTHNKFPERDSKDKQIRGLNAWISKQKIAYKKKIKIFNNDKYCDLWKNFIDDYEIDVSTWNTNLQKVKDYIDTHNKFPERDSKDKQIRGLNDWLSKQKIAYKKKIKIFNNDEYCDLWKDFIMKYDTNLINNNYRIWNNRLLDLKTYIDKFHKLPNRSSKDPNESKLSMWITTQKVNYKNKYKSMSDEIVRDRWDNFISENKLYLKY